MQRYRYKGTITVFLSLIVSLFLSLLCTLTESARVQGARAVAAASLDIGMFSVFGEFEKELLERFNVYFLDGSYGTGEFDIRKVEMRLKNFMEYTSSPGKGIILERGMNLFPMDIEDCRIDAYALATDGNGRVFYNQAVENQKAVLAADVISKVMEAYNQAKDQDKSGKEYEQDDKEIEKRLEDLEEQQREKEEAERIAKEEAEKKALEDKEAGVETLPSVPEPPPKVEIDNPLDEIKKIKKLGILGLVVKDPSAVSEKDAEKSEMASGRTLEKGNMELEDKGSDIISDGIFQEYLLDSFSNMAQGGKKGALDYQLEYILIGKSRDVDNLKGVVNRLLLMREGVNFAYAMSNTAMREAALGLAAALVGAIGIPGLVTATKAALLLAWAYGESLIDVRTLLAGGKVPLLKSEKSWKLSLENLGRLTQILEEADKGAGDGLAYKDYLRMLLAVGDKEKYPMRAIDMIEGQLRQRAATERFHADYCIAAVRAEAGFYIKPVFLRIPAAFLGTGQRGNDYTLSGEMDYSH